MPRRQRLIERREQLGLSQAEVARRARCAEGTYRRYEAGTSTPRAGDRRPLAEALEWTPVQLAHALADEPEPVNGHAAPGWLGRLAGIEQAASTLAAWEPVVVHGLLQTADYALAVESADAIPKGDDAIAHRVHSRLSRQAALDRSPDPLALQVILDESVLHRLAGDRQVMADQLDHLASMAERPNVAVRVLPLDAGRFSAAFGMFSLFWLAGAVDPWLAVTEDRAGPHYHDADHHPQAVAAHVGVYDHLVAHSLDPTASMDLIRRVSKEFR
jgi:transcriptional regulator with XRE-family HTH domain